MAAPLFSAPGPLPGADTQGLGSGSRCPWVSGKGQAQGVWGGQCGHMGARQSSGMHIYALQGNSSVCRVPVSFCLSRPNSLCRALRERSKYLMTAPAPPSSAWRALPPQDAFCGCERVPVLS